MIHPQIRQSHGTKFGHTAEIDKQMGIDPKGRARIPEAQEGIYRSTHPAEFRPGKAYHPPD